MYRRHHSHSHNSSNMSSYNCGGINFCTELTRRSDDSLHSLIHLKFHFNYSISSRWIVRSICGLGVVHNHNRTRFVANVNDFSSPVFRDFRAFIETLLMILDFP